METKHSVVKLTLMAMIAATVLAGAWLMAEKYFATLKRIKAVDAAGDVVGMIARLNSRFVTSQKFPDDPKQIAAVFNSHGLRYAGAYEIGEPAHPIQAITSSNAQAYEIEFSDWFKTLAPSTAAKLAVVKFAMPLDVGREIAKDSNPASFAEGSGKAR